MIPKGCKRLAEVDFPIAVVSRHAAKEKSIRHGHPSTLHLWWARRPLASSRAVLLALLLPDPCDPLCPPEFREQARKLLPRVGCGPGETDEALRKGLLKFIGDFANWDLATNTTYLDVSRGLVKAAHPEETPLVVDPFSGGGSIPLEALRLGCEAFASDLNPVACLILKVMLEDIPRHGPGLADELRRVGAEIKQQAEKELADLYPKDPLIPEELANGSFLLVRRHDHGFHYQAVGDVQGHLQKTRESYTHYLPLARGAEHGPNFRFAAMGWPSLVALGLKPLNIQWATPIAYLWARTVRCESPNCGAEIPLVRSFWLSKKAIRRRALRWRVERPTGEPPRVEFEVFEPRSDREVPSGTVTRAKATCPCCGAVLLPDRVCAQLVAERGGADARFDDEGQRTGGARLLAVVLLRPGEIGRHYRLATDADYAAVFKAQARVGRMLADWETNGRQGLYPVPDEPTPAGGGTGAGRAFSVRKYGMLQWGDLFTSRQKVALAAFTHCVRDLSGNVDRELLSVGLSGVVDRNAVLATWRPQADQEQVEHVFARQALPMTWDFAEAVPLSNSTGSWDDRVANTGNTVERLSNLAPRGTSAGQVHGADATEHPLPDETAQIWFTDPPYYDAVPYADLSDFFLVWLKRALPGHPLLRDPYDPGNPLTPKAREAVQDEVKRVDGRPKDSAWFEETMARAFAEGRRVLREDGIGSVVFAHKTTEGWEALLSGMIRGGWTITGSWPIATEMATRLRVRDSAALATSVHLICRPRTEDGVGDWAEVLRELPRRVRDWMERLQKEHVRGADLVFACIGPALEIFSRYARVETAEGREVPLAEYLEKVWEVVGRAALEQILGDGGGAGGLEEDARLTALFLWTLQSSNGVHADPGRDHDAEPDDEDDETPKKKKAGYKLIFDVARRFAQPLGIHLDQWEGRIIETDKGLVRLLPVAERARQLFGEGGAPAAAASVERTPTGSVQLTLFPDLDVVPQPKARGRKALTPGPSPAGRGEEARRREPTTLDRVHAAMLLQRGGQSNALRALLRAELDRGPDFLRLANALSALYPRDADEKRLLDAMLLAVPR